MRNNTLSVGAFLLFLLLFITFVGPYLPFIDQELTEEFMRRENGKISIAPFAPDLNHPFGVDHKGRDLLSLIVVGAKETLFSVFAIVIIRYLLATFLGFSASNHSGLFYWLLQGWNKLFSLVPTIFLVILISNIPYFIFSTNRMIWMILIIALLEVGRVGVIIHEHKVSLSKSLFIQAGISVGNNRLQMFKRYYFPHLFSQILIGFVSDLGRTMFLIGQLGFFSIFISHTWQAMESGPGLPLYQIHNISNSWPLLLKDALGDVNRYPWIPLWASFAMAFSVITFNIFGEGLRKYYDRR